MKSTYLVICSFFLVSCVTSTHALKLNESDGRIGFEDTRVSERRDAIMSRVAEKFSADVTCSSVKTGMTNSRKAVLLEKCSVPLVGGELDYAGHAIEELRYRFIDDRLLQMEMVFAKAADASSVSAAIVTQLDSELGLARNPAEATATPTGSAGKSASLTAYSSWSGAKDLVELMTDSRTRLKISDARLVKTVIALKSGDG